MTDLANAGKVQFISGQWQVGVWRPAGRFDPGPRLSFAINRPRNQCPVSVRGNRKNKHELHSNGVNDGSECEYAKKMRPVATLLKS